MIDELLSTFENQLATHTTQRGPTLGQISAIQVQASMSEQDFYYEEVHYLKNNEGNFFQPHNYHSDWRTYEDFSYGN